MSAPRDPGFINLSNPARTTDKYGLDRHDHKWLSNFLLQHAASSGLLKGAFYSMLKAKGKREANAQVIKFHERSVRRDLWLSMDDAKLRDWCENKARHCRLTLTNPTRDPIKAQKRICVMLNDYGIEYPLKSQSDLLDGFCPFETVALKLGDMQWWRRKVRELQKRELEDQPEYVNFALRAALLRDMLDRHSVAYSLTNAFDSADAVDIAFMAGDFTAKVSCWR